VQVLTFRAGSAGGPKPGRAGFYLKLGGTRERHVRFDSLSIRKSHRLKVFNLNADTTRRHLKGALRNPMNSLDVDFEPTIVQRPRGVISDGCARSRRK